MKPLFQKFRALLKPLLRFGLGSAVATVADFAVFSVLFPAILPVFSAEIAAATVGMVVNFVLQRAFVFQPRRGLGASLALSTLFSVVLMVGGGFAMSAAISIPMAAAHPLLAKAVLSALKFGLNFISKRWVFEKRLWH